LAKIERMCFSTALSLRTSSASAIHAFDLPSAISPSTSSAREERTPSGPRRATSCRTTSGSIAQTTGHVDERREDRDADQRHEQREPSRQPGDLHAEADDRGHAAEEDERELAPGLEAQRAEEDPRHGESLGRRVAAHGAASRRPR